MKVSNVLRSIWLDADNLLFSSNLKQDLAVGVSLVIQYIFNVFTCLASTHRRHVMGDKGITRKYRNHETQRSTWKVFGVYPKTSKQGASNDYN